LGVSAAGTKSKHSGFFPNDKQNTDTECPKSKCHDSKTNVDKSIFCSLKRLLPAQPDNRKRGHQKTFPDANRQGFYAEAHLTFAINVGAATTTPKLRKALLVILVIKQHH